MVTRGRLVALAVMAAFLVVLVVAERAQAGGDSERIGGVFRFREHGAGVTAWGWPIMLGFLASASMLVGSWASGGADRVLYLANAVLVRVVLLVAVVFMFVFTDLPQLEAKSLTWRTIVYPTLAFAIPVAYWLSGRSGPYPWFVDVNWAFVFTFDIVSNDLHWYGTWYYWDAFVHLVNSVPFFAVMAVVLLAVERHISASAGFRTVMVFGLLLFFSLHAFWETYEFMADHVAGTELQPGGMEEATMDNMTGIVGALVAVWLLDRWRRRGILDERAVDPLDGYIRGTLKRERQPTRNEAGEAGRRAVGRRLRG